MAIIFDKNLEIKQNKEKGNKIFMIKRMNSNFKTIREAKPQETRSTIEILSIKTNVKNILKIIKNLKKINNNLDYKSET